MRANILKRKQSAKESGLLIEIAVQDLTGSTLSRFCR